jgi:DNA polymerase-3 subunit delta'
MTDLQPWPAALAGTPVIAVIEQAIARRRLSHSLLLHGDDMETLGAVAHGIADRLLNGEPRGGHLPDRSTSRLLHAAARRQDAPD